MEFLRKHNGKLNWGLIVIQLIMWAFIVVGLVINTWDPPSVLMMGLAVLTIRNSIRYHVQTKQKQQRETQ